MTRSVPHSPPTPPSRSGKKPSKDGARRAATRPAATRPSPAPRRGARRDRADDPELWNLRLYVAGQTPRSLNAFANLKRICEEHLKGRYRIEVVDLQKDPQLARGDQILAIPTLVRRLPSPIKKIIGDLSNTERFLVGFDLKPRT